MMAQTAEKLNQAMAIQATDLDMKNAGKFQLGVSIGSEEILISAIDLSNSKIILFEKYAFSPFNDAKGYSELIRRIITSKPLPVEKFKAVVLVLETSKYTVIPSGLYDDQKAEELIKLNCNLEENESVLSNDLKALEAKIIYAIPGSLIDAATSLLQPKKTYSLISVLIQQFLRISRKDNHPKAFLNIRLNFIDLIVLKGKKLLLANSFPYQTPEDVSYFTLFSLEQLELDPATIPVILSGEVEEKSAIHESLYKFIKTVDFMLQDDQLKVPEDFKAIPEHFYYPLFHLHLCE